MSKNVKIGIIIAVLVVIAIVAYVVYKNGKKETKSSSDSSSNSSAITTNKNGSTAQGILNLGGEVMKDVANSDLL